MISKRSSTPKRFDECTDALAQADWIVQHLSDIVSYKSSEESEASEDDSLESISVKEYEVVLDQLIAANKLKEAYFLATFVLDHHSYFSNLVGSWHTWIQTNPGVSAEVEAVNISKFGPAAKFSPSRVIPTSTATAKIALRILYSLEWLMENKPNDSMIALLNSLPLQVPTDSPVMTQSASVLDNKIFTMPKLLSSANGVALFLGKSFAASIDGIPIGGRFITEDLKKEAKALAAQEMTSYYAKQAAGFKKTAC